jgi:hypothetical protein
MVMVGYDHSDGRVDFWCPPISLHSLRHTHTQPKTHKEMAESFQDYIHAVPAKIGQLDDQGCHQCTYQFSDIPIRNVDGQQVLDAHGEPKYVSKACTICHLVQSGNK